MTLTWNRDIFVVAWKNVWIVRIVLLKLFHVKIEKKFLIRIKNFTALRYSFQYNRVTVPIKPGLPGIPGKENFSMGRKVSQDRDILGSLHYLQVSYIWCLITDKKGPPDSKSCGCSSSVEVAAVRSPSAATILAESRSSSLFSMIFRDRRYRQRNWVRNVKLLKSLF